MKKRFSKMMARTAAVFLAAGAAWAQTFAPSPPGKSAPPPLPLVVSMGSDCPPYSFVNALGRPDGQFVDLWNAWSARTGVPVTFNIQPLVESFAAFKAGGIAVHAGFPQPPDRTPGVKFVSPLAPCVMRLFLSHNLRGVGSLDNLRGIHVGVAGGYPSQPLAATRIPADMLRVYPSLGALFDAVEKGDLLAFIADQAVGVACLSDRGQTGKFYYLNPPLETSRFAVAVHEGDLSCASLVGEGFEAIPKSERDEIARRWERPDPFNAAPSLVIACSRNSPPFSYVDDFQQLCGLIPDLWKLWSQKVNRTLEFRFADSSNVAEMVRSGQADIHYCIEKTPETMAEFAFSEPIYAAPLMLFVKKGSRVADLGDLKSGRVALFLGNTFESPYLTRAYPALRQVLYPNMEAMFKAVASGEVDACLARASGGMTMLRRLGFGKDIEAVQPPAIVQRFYAGVRRGNNYLLGLINEGLAGITYSEKSRFEDRWIPDPDFRGLSMQGEAGALTPRESEWLDAHPVIRLGFNTDRPPFAFMQNHGEFGGIVSDYEYRLSRFIGFPFAVQTRPTGVLMDLAKDGKIDVLAAVEDVPELRNDFLFTRPYIRTPLVVVMRADALYVDNLATLKGKRFVARMQYPGAFQLLRQDYPWLNPEAAPTVEQGLELVRNGGADAYIGIMAAVIPALNNVNANLRVVLSTPYAAHIGFAVRKDWPVLVDVLDKALDAIPGEERDRIHNAWVAVPRDKFNWRRLTTLALIVLAGAGLVIAVVTVWNRLLMREIAFRQKHEQELRQARDAAYAASQAKSMFLANMSHEIRTPLNAIIGFAQVLGRASNLPRESHEQVETIMRSGEHLLGLINDILEISKIEADRITAESAPFDLVELLRDLEAMFRVRTNAKGIVLRVMADASTPRRIVSDVGKVRQILINLIGNAVKFTQAGQVTVRVSSVSGSDRGLLRCEIEDTGPGISARDREKIFESFVQGEGIAGTRGGTGLGLTISRRYAKLLGGDIALVWTEPGKGSLFRCEIPYDTAPEIAAAVSSGQNVVRARMEDGRAPRVIVVDDEAINRRVIVRTLESIGFEIREAATGQEALDLFIAWPPDLVLMDIRMPGMDGIQATKLIREKPQGLVTPVIAITASAFESDKDRILSAGLAGYIRKPFKLNDLLQVIKVHLRAVYEYGPSSAPGHAARDGEAPAELARWPESVRSALSKAAREADVAELEQLLESMPDTPGRAALRRLVDVYDYPALIAALAAPQPAPRGETPA